MPLLGLHHARQHSGYSLISFYPLKSDVLALAVSNDPRAVTSIGSGGKTQMPVPREPFWISVPAATFSRLDGFPPSTSTRFSVPWRRQRK